MLSFFQLNVVTGDTTRNVTLLVTLLVMHSKQSTKRPNTHTCWPTICVHWQ